MIVGGYSPSDFEHDNGVAVLRPVADIEDLRLDAVGCEVFPRCCADEPTVVVKIGF